MQNKLSGSFYTPEGVASWMVKRVLGSFSIFSNNLTVLEPSCGDGVFLKVLKGFPEYSLEIDAVELSLDALEKARDNYGDVNFYNEDFLFWEKAKKYDIVIGNPPYIVKKSLTSPQAVQCKIIHANIGMAEREVANIWTSFVLKGAELLNKSGILAFVLPTELLQVNYSAEIREYLLSKFEKIEVISFRHLAFDNLDQDTVILFAYKKAAEKGLFFTEISSVENLTHNFSVFPKSSISGKEKWSSYLFNEDEAGFIKGLVKRCSTIGDYCNSSAGIVTAANDYFIINQEYVDKYDLSAYVKPIIQKGMFVNGSAEISPVAYEELRLNGKPCYLIDLNGISEDKFSKGLVEYLSIGESLDIPNRYKCLQRNRWFDIPSIWKSEGFFFKRGHNYPKLLVNNADVYVTDSAYRVRMLPEYRIEDFTMSFYNSLTLLCSEMFGRYYGGGVLELTPNEFRQLPLPYTKEVLQYDQFVNNFEEKSDIHAFLQKNDKAILSDGMGLSSGDINKIQNLYQAVKNRRLRKGLL